MLPARGAMRRGGLAPLRLPPPGAPAVVSSARRGLPPYLSARLPVVAALVELRLNRVRLHVDLTILAQLASALLTTRM
jgi:hypothetical protein